jgi:hypothetical protein
MSKRFTVGILAASAILLSGSAFAVVTDIIVDVRPASLLVNWNADNFKALGTVTLPTGQQYQEVEQPNSVSTVPNLKLGVGIDTGNAYLDLTGGAGMLVNDRFRSLLLDLDAAYQFKFRKNVLIGPHLGLAYFTSPEWYGDAEVEFSDSSGALFGVQLSVGFDILFTFAIDYAYIRPFDVESTAPNWTTSEDSVDFSGLLFQFGMKGRF